MNLKDLQKQAHLSWFNYGEAIKKHFRFEADGKMLAAPLMKVITTDDAELIQEFIDYVEERITDLLGESCHNCRFFQPDLAGRKGTCNTPKISKTAKYKPHMLWPQMRADSWCPLFEPKH